MPGRVCSSANRAPPRQVRGLCRGALCARGRPVWCAGAIGQPQRRQWDDALDRFDLTAGGVTGGGVEHEQCGVRGTGIELSDDANDLFEFRHQTHFVLQPSGRVDDEDIGVLRPCGLQCFEGKSCRIRAWRT